MFCGDDNRSNCVLILHMISVHFTANLWTFMEKKRKIIKKNNRINLLCHVPNGISNIQQDNSPIFLRLDF